MKEETNSNIIEKNDEDFVPRGAMIFLILILILGSIIYFGSYFLQIYKL